jgi:hypothetical protein
MRYVVFQRSGEQSAFGRVVQQARRFGSSSILSAMHADSRRLTLDAMARMALKIVVSM